MTEKIIDIAQRLIDIAENVPPYSGMTWRDAESMILALGGNPKVSQCEHGPTICIYIAALMVRRQEQQK